MICITNKVLLSTSQYLYRHSGKLCIQTIKTTMKSKEIDKAFSIFNDGKGLDHWSYSSTSTPFAKNLINYTFSQDVRRTFAFRYKANFGNLVNNTVQRLIGNKIWKTEKQAMTKWDRDYKVSFEKELEYINKKPPVDDKDAYGKEKMIDFAHDCVGVTKKVVQEISGKKDLQCERHVRKKEMTMIKDILGKIDYETDDGIKPQDDVIIELKTKPPNIRKIKNKEEWSMSSQALPIEPTIENLTQTAFYYMCSKKKPFLVYTNDKEHIIFDDKHELMRTDHLEFLYFKMVEKILLWERMIMFCKGNLSELALMCEPPDLNHYFYYKDLATEQTQLISKLWGINNNN